MADLQRIHPVPDLESAAAGSPVPHPAAPLLPFPSSSSSEKGDPSIAPTSTLPPYNSHFRGQVLCYLLVSLGLLIGFLIATFFLVFRPKLPSYSITGLHVTNLTLSSNHTLSTAIVVNVTSHNPNERIGIYYDGGSWLRVRYRDTTELCQGYLPVLYQGYRNTTVIAVPLSGVTPHATEISRGLQLRGNDGVPLVVEGRMRARVKLRKLKVGKRMEVRLRCEVVVNSLNSTDDEILMTSSRCKIHF